MADHTITHNHADALADLTRMRQQRDDYAAELDRITGAGARERLARHLWLQAHLTDPYAQAHWDAGGDQHVSRGPWLHQADLALATITAKEA